MNTLEIKTRRLEIAHEAAVLNQQSLAIDAKLAALQTELAELELAELKLEEYASQSRVIRPQRQAVAANGN